MKWKRLYNCTTEPCHEILTLEIEAETEEEAIQKFEQKKTDMISGYFLGPPEKSVIPSETIR